eukprot:gene38642-47726_t
MRVHQLPEDVALSGGNLRIKEIISESPEVLNVDLKMAAMQIQVFKGELQALLLANEVQKMQGLPHDDVSFDKAHALHYAVAARPHFIVPILDFIVDTPFEPLMSHLNADVNAIDVHGNTALHVAAILHNFKAISILLSRGADKDILNFEGKTALTLVKKVVTDNQAFAEAMGLTGTATGRATDQAT